MKREISVIPIPDVRLIPRYLVDQVKDRVWTTDDFYEHLLAMPPDDSNLLLGLIDKQNQVKGFVWLTIDTFQQLIFINTFSADPMYQRRNRLMKFITRYIKEMAKVIGIPKVIWAAKRTKALEKYGFAPSDWVLMEENV